MFSMSVWGKEEGVNYPADYVCGLIRLQVDDASFGKSSYDLLTPLRLLEIIFQRANVCIGSGWE